MKESCEERVTREVEEEGHVTARMRSPTPPYSIDDASTPPQLHHRKAKLDSPFQGVYWTHLA